MSPLDELGRDVRYALRQVRRNPVFSAVAVATLALGIGANSAIFSVVYAVLLRPLPYHDPERLVSAGRMLVGEYLFLRDATKTLGGGMALYRPNVGFNLSEVGGAERVTGAVVSANLFSTLGVEAMTGRAFTPGDERPGERAVLLLSHAFWRERLGADASTVGRDILVDGESRMVVGVMPPAFAFPSARTQIWIPYTFDRSHAVALWGAAYSAGTLSPGSRRAPWPLRPERNFARSRRRYGRRTPCGCSHPGGERTARSSSCRTASWATCA